MNGATGFIAFLSQTQQAKDPAARAKELWRMPRIQFQERPVLKEYRKLLNLQLQEIALIKALSGDLPIAQKTLSKLSEHIENTHETIFLKETNIRRKRILIIDDVLGSGATMNEIARKLYASGRSIFGYAITRSYKGFDVIKEV